MKKAFIFFLPLLFSLSFAQSISSPQNFQHYPEGFPFFVLHTNPYDELLELNAFYENGDPVLKTENGYNSSTFRIAFGWAGTFITVQLSGGPLVFDEILIPVTYSPQPDFLHPLTDSVSQESLVVHFEWLFPVEANVSSQSVQFSIDGVHFGWVTYDSNHVILNVSVVPTNTTIDIWILYLNGILFKKTFAINITEPPQEPPPAEVALVTPAENSTLGSLETFSWTSNSQIKNTRLLVGFSVGKKEIFDSGVIPVGSSTMISRSISLPLNGVPIFVRLSYKKYGSTPWIHLDSVFESTAGVAPQLLTPTGGNLSPTQIFSWSSNGFFVQKWQLRLGYSQGKAQIYNSGPVAPSTLSAVVTGIPANVPIHVRFSYKVGATWNHKDYVFNLVSAGTQGGN